ncbi:nuclear transport factor 2 family protein [[Mycobacterium] kokjensenii]|uniref:Nuclear transport factor 2 family protein n=1 Tax=[Mycobacterium] kokjensenii TaxID=3064287 RepID=A0ABN9N6P5_9MYCO|nr:nuclear transport factor 2 family protein [Mycolicibacter sp. MU0083]CAJ1501410.1 nuclear transport factor 2 family protein [Mycolicibacter sp. MU0083]
MPEHASPYDAAALLAAVEQSPKAVAVHDKAAWVGIFAADGQVNDPVGSTPHVGTGAIERFFDTFIAPNTIKFDVQHDVVAGMSVFRDLTVYTTMSTGVTMEIPMHLRYDLVAAGADGPPKIQRLFAHWELPYMIMQLLTAGGRGLLASLILGPQLVRHQGFAGGAGFLRGLSGVHKRGKRRVADFVGALADGDSAGVSALLAPGATLSLDGVSETSIAEFVSAAQHLEVEKLLAAGPTVTATAHLNGRRGVALFEFSGGATRPGTISAVRLYLG